MHSYDHILYRAEDTTARITLNRPEKRNAISYEMLAEINHALWEADNDTQIHSVVICGSGEHFCSGYDITPGYRRFPKLGDQDGRRYRRPDYYASIEDDTWTLQRNQDLYMAIFDMTKPVIAEIRGLCLAGGTDLALVCDIIIASKSASFGYPAVRDMGTPPAHMWLYHLGPQWAKRLLLTGDTLDATDAASLGLILKAVPDECLEEEVRRLCNRLGMIDSALLGANKRIVNLGMELMGARTLQRLAAENDGRAHQADSPQRFRALAKSGGLKTAIQERNRAFGSNRVRIDGPDEDDRREPPVP